MEALNSGQFSSFAVVKAIGNIKAADPYGSQDKINTPQLKVPSTANSQKYQADAEIGARRKRWNKSQITALRTSQGFTQKELAKLWRVAQNTMGAWEHDESKARQIHQFARLCKALACEHTVFLESSEQSTLDQPTDADTSRIDLIRQQIRTPVRFSSPIAYLRVEKGGLSQEALAEIVGVSLNTIQNWESGKSAAQRHNQLARLCELLNCTYRDLVTETDNELSGITPPNKFIENQYGDINENPLIELEQECDDKKIKGREQKST